MSPFGPSGPFMHARRVGAYWLHIATATVKEIDEDHCIELAAQLAFYFQLALFPALLAFVSLVGHLQVEHAAADLLVTLAQVVPTQLVELLEGQLAEIANGDRAGIVTAGLAGAFWSSSAAMLAIIKALNRTYRVSEWRPWWKRRLVAIGLTLALGLFMTTSLVLLLAGPDVVDRIATMLGAPGVVHSGWQFVRWPTMVALVIIGIDIVYYVAPNRVTHWSWTTPGSLVATAMWIGSSLLFKLYVTHMGSYNATYGAIGGVIVVMLWLYVSSFAILVGAELNSVIEEAERGPFEPVQEAAAR